MEKAKDEIIRNCFTKYIETALNRARRDYMKNEQKRNNREVVSELELQFLMKQADEYQDSVLLSDVVCNIPWNPEAVSSYLNESVGEKMVITLSCLTSTELLIVFAKVFRQMTFIDIAERLGLDWKKVASSYSYARKKMKKGWEKNGV